MIQKVEISWRREDGEGAIPVQVVYSARRTMGLEIKEDGRVFARVPKGLPDRAVMELIQGRQEWIVKKWFLLKKRRESAARRPQPDYVRNPELEKLYREKARERLTERMAYFAALMGVSYNRIAIRSSRTRWGSCSVRGNLSFHWKLILMPPQILDYVVVHELAHRKEMNHSRRFWDQVEQVLPDYKQRRTWLKEKGAWV